MTIADTLREARRRIEEPEKWGKGNDMPHGIECSFVALDQAGYLKPGYKEAVRFFRSAIAPLSISPDSVSIIAWNDAPERTHMEVLAAFDRAIALSGG